MSDRGTDYDARFAELAARGAYVHGEADLVDQLLDRWILRRPATVLDAGCGTGRVAIELARRGHRTVGIDADLDMIATARRKAPQLLWHHADLAAADLGALGVAPQSIDLVVAAGNVMIFLRPGTLDAVLGSLAGVLCHEGLLVAGFSLDAPRPLGTTLGMGRPDALDLATYDRACQSCGLHLAQRLATWDGEPYSGGSYAVSIHRRSAPAPAPSTRSHSDPKSTSQWNPPPHADKPHADKPHADKEVRRR